MKSNDKTKLSKVMTYGAVGVTGVAATVDAAFLSGYPGFTTLTGVAIAHLGNSLKLKHKRAIEMFDYIDNNREVFTTKLIESEVFQDGFVYALERYIRLRTEEKRLGALLLFKSFAEAEAKEDFPLERYFDTLEKISTDALRTLAFIRYEVIEPKLEQGRQAKARDNMYATDTISYFTKNPESGQPLSKLVSEAISNKYFMMDRSNFESFDALDQQTKHEYMKERRESYVKHRERLLGPIDELIYLGLLVQGSGSTKKGLALDSTESESWWRLSNFAASFIEYIENVGLDDGEPNDR